MPGKMTQEALYKELKRLEGMKEYENKYKLYSKICGIDEAGRGPLAGPVVAGAVILDPEKEILFLNDSKKLSEKRREQLYEEIINSSIAYGIGVVDVNTIDSINILNATYEAMRIAVSGLNISPDILLIDAVKLPDIDIEQVPIIKGDAKSVSIAAASILAKVTRDRIMKEYAKLYPEYGFEKHKGYGTSFHIEKIKQLGATPIHRKTFIKNFV